MINSYIELDVIEETRLDLNTKLTVFISYDEKKVHGKVSYMGNRLVSEKIEDNTPAGIAKVKSFLSKFKSGQDVEQYFNIKGGLKVSLDKIVEEIIKTKTLAEEDILGGDKKPNPATLQTRLARQRSAKGMLPILYNQYKSELMKRTFCVLLVGEKSEEAAKMLADQGMVSVSADAFYQEILDLVPSNMYNGRTNSSALFDVMSRHIEDKAGSIDIASYPSPIFKSSYNTKVDSEEKALAFLKRIVNEEIGTEMLGYDALEKAAKIAVNENFAGAKLPIAVSLKDVSIAKDVIAGLKKTSSVFHMVTIEKVDKELEKLSSAKVKTLDEDNINKAIEAIKKTKGE